MRKPLGAITGQQNIVRVSCLPPLSLDSFHPNPVVPRILIPRGPPRKPFRFLCPARIHPPAKQPPTGASDSRHLSYRERVSLSGKGRSVGTAWLDWRHTIRNPNFFDRMSSTPTNLLSCPEYRNNTRIVIPLAPSFEGSAARALLLPEGKIKQIPSPPRRIRNDNLLSWVPP